MANTVTARESTGIVAVGFNGCAGNGEIMRARVSLDTTSTDFEIDNPQTSPSGSYGKSTDGTDQRIFVVGLSYVTGAASTVAFKSKVGAAAAVTLSSKQLAANSGESFAIDQFAPLFTTDLGGALLVNVSAVSTATLILVHYVIATSHAIKVT